MSRYHESWISKVLGDKIIDKMLNNQYKQVGIKDLTIFEKNPSAGQLNKGFTWSNTTDGHGYWENIMDLVRSYKIQHNL